MNEQRSNDYSKRKVLVADDEAVIRDLLGRILVEQVGCQYATARNGYEVIDQLEQEHYDVVVTDMVMPGPHGLELISTLRERHPDIDIVVLTGFGEAFPYVDVVQAGANDFISKPHKPQEIEAKLFRLFKERELREKLFLAEEKYRSLFELSVEGKLLVDPQDYRIADANRAFCDLVERPREDIVEGSLFGLVDESERDRFEQAFRIFSTGGQGALASVTVHRAAGDDVYADISATFISVPGEKIVFLTFRDVTEKRQRENQLVRVAHTDALTGLSNKRGLQGRIEAVLNEAQANNSQVSLLFIDLDNFKYCNDTYGHQAGDQVLRTVGVLIQQCIRGADDGFRYGGDEFAVVLRGTPKDGAVSVATRLIGEFEQEERFGTTMSIGIAEFTPGMDPDDFIKSADGALYKAKSEGKNRVHVV